MTHVDSFLLDAIEWLCRRFQMLTGHTNVWLGLYFWTSELWLRIVVGLFCGGVFYALTQTIFKVSIEEYEVNAYRRVAKGFRNPRRVRDAVLRMSFVTLAVLLWYPVVFVYINLRVRIVLLSYFLVLLTTVLLY